MRKSPWYRKHRAHVSERVCPARANPSEWVERDAVGASGGSGAMSQADARMHGTGSPGMPARVGYSELGGAARHGTRGVLRQSGVGRGARMVAVAVGTMTALVNYGPEYGAVELRTVPVPALGP